MFNSFFPYVLEVAQSDHARRDATALGVIRTLSRIDRFFITLLMADVKGMYPASHIHEHFTIHKWLRQTA